jgi:hypothetical protein
VHAVGRIARVGSPALLTLAIVMFLLPFLTVSCDTPGGYGRVERGGTTKYSGLDLAFGSSPSVEREHLRQRDAQQDDRLDAQPVLLVALVGSIASLFLALRLRERYALRLAVVIGTTVALLLGVFVARGELIDKVEAQSDRAFAAGEHVKVGAGLLGATFFILLAAALGVLDHWISTRASGPDPPGE